MDAEALGRDRRLIVGERKTSQGVLWLVPQLDAAEGCEGCTCRGKPICMDIKCFPSDDAGNTLDQSVIAIESTRQAMDEYITAATTLKLLE